MSFLNVMQRQVSFRWQLFSIMFPVTVYLTVAFASLKIAGITQPDLDRTERAIERLKHDVAEGDFGTNSQRYVENLSASRRANDLFRSDAARWERFVAGGIIVGVILQVGIAVRVYYLWQRNSR